MEEHLTQNSTEQVSMSARQEEEASRKLPLAEMVAAYRNAHCNEQDTLDRVTSLLAREKRHRRETGQIRYMTPVLALLIALQFYFWKLRHHPHTFWVLLPADLVICLVFFGAVWLQLSRHRWEPDMGRLVPITDRKHIGTLLSALQSRKLSLRRFARENLIALLPTLTTDDATLLKKQDRDILIQHLALLPDDPRYRALTASRMSAVYRSELDLRLAILKALEQVGSAQEVPVVAALAQGRSASSRKTPVPTELQETAQTCLPSLKARVADQRAEAQLLRASSLSAAAAHDLLRPATEGSETPATQLLRPGDSPS